MMGVALDPPLQCEAWHIRRLQIMCYEYEASLTDPDREPGKAELPMDRWVNESSERLPWRAYIDSQTPEETDLGGGGFFGEDEDDW